VGKAADSANILIVDDRPDKLLAFQAILEDLRQNVHTATSGEDALRAVLARDYALILLDVNMPGIDGFETAALIRQRKKSAHIPIIFITADYGDEARTVRGYSLGAVDYIASPVVPEVLRAKVKVFVDLFLLAEQAKRQVQERIALAEEQAARAAAEKASHRLAFVSEASVALSMSLDLAAITRELSRLVVPVLGDACVVSLVQEDGRLGRAEATHVGTDPADGLVSRALDNSSHAWLTALLERARASGKAEVVSCDPPASFDAQGGEPGPAFNELLVSPLIAHGRPLGAMALALGAWRGTFDADTLSIATDIAGRAAIALDNALLYHKSQEEDRRKNEFLAMLAHELRNPLAPITNAVHVMQAAEGDPARLKWARDVIGRQLKQMIRLVDDLLDVSRITRGKIELKIEALDVAALIAAAVETSRPNLDALSHTLTVSVPSEPLRVLGDFARVAQILSNLINNAAKYTPSGGRVTVSAAREGGEIVFRVQDTGIGIPAEYLTHIFEPFTQIDRTADRSQGGLGIGLALVRRLTEMQRGSAVAYSAGRNQGSEFVVRLPAAPRERNPSQDDGEGAAANISSNGARVLIVDDNHDVADTTAEVMRMNGCDVHVVYDSQSAYDATQRLRPDAVLLDIGLPGMDGYQLAERLRAVPENRRMLLVAVSGYGQEEDRARSRAAGFDYHVVKPIDPDALTRLLGTLREQRQKSAAENVVHFPARRFAE
jgi:signal transduction histidine kinase/DNA-binding response OmpR family regulator